jgi:hypothetical protein
LGSCPNPLISAVYTAEILSINSHFEITYKGWSRIEELLRERASINQGFIAISFADETKPQSEAIKEAFDIDTSRPHFDIAQKSMIVWKDINDLIEKLTNRIKATIGFNN